MKIIFRDGLMDFEWPPKCSDENFEKFKKGFEKIFGKFDIMEVEEPYHEVGGREKGKPWSVDELALFWECDDIDTISSRTGRGRFSVVSKLTSFKPLVDKRLYEKGIIRKPTKKELNEIMTEAKK